MSQFHKYSFVSPWNFRWEIETARKLLQNPQLPRCPWKSILWLMKKTMASHTGPYLFTDSYKYVFLQQCRRRSDWATPVLHRRTLPSHICGFSGCLGWPWGVCSVQGRHIKVCVSIMHTFNVPVLITLILVSTITYYLMQGSSPDRQLGAGVWEGWNVGQVNLDLQIKDWNRWSSGSCFSSLTWRNAWILQSLLKVA